MDFVKIKLVNALIQVESGGADYAVGDVKLKDKAYGPLQIRQPYVDDVNAKLGTKFKAQDCLSNRNVSILIFQTYMLIYANFTRLGRIPTDEDIARIHNGGPAGYKNPKTVAYWNKVKKYL